jgi:hypothetical protein
LASATLVTVGSSTRLVWLLMGDDEFPPRQEYAVQWMPLDLQNSTSLVLEKVKLINFLREDRLLSSGDSYDGL